MWLAQKKKKTWLQTCLCPPGSNLIRWHCTYSPAGMILYLNAISCHSNKEQSLAPMVHYVPSFAPVSHFVVTGQKSWQHTRSICSPSSREINVIIHLVPVSWLTWPRCLYHTICSRFSSKHRRNTSTCTVLTGLKFLFYYCPNILCMLILSLWPACFSQHLRL